VRRNLFLNWNVDVAPIFDQLATRHVLKNIELKRLSAAMGWQGCNGFNRLIQQRQLVKPQLPSSRGCYSKECVAAEIA
jgi:hypothetical protein